VPKPIDVFAYERIVDRWAASPEYDEFILNVDSEFIDCTNPWSARGAEGQLAGPYVGSRRVVRARA